MSKGHRSQLEGGPVTKLGTICVLKWVLIIIDITYWIKYEINDRGWNIYMVSDCLPQKSLLITKGEGATWPWRSLADITLKRDQSQCCQWQDESRVHVPKSVQGEGPSISDEPISVEASYVPRRRNILQNSGLSSIKVTTVKEGLAAPARRQPDMWQLNAAHDLKRNLFAVKEVVSTSGQQE